MKYEYEGRTYTFKKTTVFNKKSLSIRFDRKVNGYERFNIVPRFQSIGGLREEWELSHFEVDGIEKPDQYSTEHYSGRTVSTQPTQEDAIKVVLSWAYQEDCINPLRQVPLTSRKKESVGTPEEDWKPMSDDERAIIVERVRAIGGDQKAGEMDALLRSTDEAIAESKKLRKIIAIGQIPNCPQPQQSNRKNEEIIFVVNALIMLVLLVVFSVFQ